MDIALPVIAKGRSAIWAIRRVRRLHRCPAQGFPCSNVNWAGHEQEAWWGYSTPEMLNHACLIYIFIQNQPHLLCPLFWLHATSTLPYHPPGGLDHPGQPPSATCCLAPSWIVRTPPCMTSSSQYAARFDIPDFLIWSLDTSSWKTMLSFFLPSTCKLYFVSVLRMSKYEKFLFCCSL